MKNSFLFTFILLSCCTSGPRHETTNDAKKPFDVFLDEYYSTRLALYPLEATQAGYNQYNNLLPNDVSEGYRQKLKAFYSQSQTDLAQYNPDSLDRQQKVSYAIFKREMAMNIEGLSFHDNLMPIHQFWGITLTIPQLGSGQSYQPFHSVKDYDNFLGRADGFVIWIDSAIMNMSKGLKEGYTYPKILMERVLPQAKDMQVSNVKQSIFWHPIANFPDSFSTENKVRLTNAYTSAILDKIIPSYKKLHDFLVREYIPKTRTTTGISDIPGGKAYYEYLTRFWTTTNLTPEEIYETGIKEVTRIKEEMKQIKEQVGFKGDLKSFFTYINDDKKFMPYKTPEEVIEGFNTIHRTMEPQLKRLFNKVPKSKFTVRRTEAFREASASAEYNQGSPDGSRPGIFYVPILDAAKFNYTGMETLFLHEAIPGHHYQSSLQMEDESLPRFRRFLWFGAYGEGWALYSESLGKELGLYTDPYQYFGHLGDEMHRAIRLVVDVGMHAKGLTREEAIHYMMENEPISEQGAVAEIERYMAIPGQALSYKIGQLKISALRKKAEQALGNKFNIALFHDEVLSYGCLPLDVLETVIDQWIADQKEKL